MHYSRFGLFAGVASLCLASSLEVACAFPALPASPDSAAIASFEKIQFGPNSNQQRPRAVPQQRPQNVPAQGRPGPGPRRGTGNALGAAVAAGVLGAVVGGIIANQAQPRPAYPPQRYYPAQGYPAYEQDDDFDEFAPPPRSRAWYDYCSRRYRSFDPRSGTFVDVYGVRHFCR